MIRAVLEMGHIPVGMEMFSAADDEQWKIIARHIDESDYYAVVVAHRLGSLVSEGLSYTRKEYEYAVKQGVPILGFIIDDNAAWPATKIDNESSALADLANFKTRVREKPVSFWSTAEDLYGRFSVALMKAITANPREGWVRASESGGGPQVTAEIIRLSSENASLRRRLEEAQEESTKQEADRLRETVGFLLNTKRTPSYRYSPQGEWQTDAEETLFSIFFHISQEMLIEATTKELAQILAMNIRVDTNKSWDLVALNQLRGIIADLVTLDLVQPSARKHAVSDKDEYWTLTALGKQVLKRTRQANLSKKKSESPEAEEAAQPSAREDVQEEQQGETASP